MRILRPLPLGRRAAPQAAGVPSPGAQRSTPSPPPRPPLPAHCSLQAGLTNYTDASLRGLFEAVARPVGSTSNNGAQCNQHLVILWADQATGLFMGYRIRRTPAGGVDAECNGLVRIQGVAEPLLDSAGPVGNVLRTSLTTNDHEVVSGYLWRAPSGALHWHSQMLSGGCGRAPRGGGGGCAL